MFWIIIGVQFLLTAASYVRWLRVAQQSGYTRGSVRAAMREHVETVKGERVMYIVIIVLAAIGTVIWPLAFVGAALWFQWPRSLPYVDRANPLVWDRTVWRVASTALALHFLVFALAFLLTFVVGLYVVSLLTLVTIAVTELAVRLVRPRALAA